MVANRLAHPLTDAGVHVNVHRCQPTADVLLATHQMHSVGNVQCCSKCGKIVLVLPVADQQEMDIIAVFCQLSDCLNCCDEILHRNQPTNTADDKRVCRNPQISEYLAACMNRVFNLWNVDSVGDQLHPLCGKATAFFHATGHRGRITENGVGSFQSPLHRGCPQTKFQSEIMQSSQHCATFRVNVDWDACQAASEASFDERAPVVGVDDIHLVFLEHPGQPADGSEVITRFFLDLNDGNIIPSDPLGSRPATVQADNQRLKPRPVKMIRQMRHATFDPTHVERVDDVGDANHFVFDKCHAIATVDRDANVTFPSSVWAEYPKRSKVDPRCP